MPSKSKVTKKPAAKKVSKPVAKPKAKKTKGLAWEKVQTAEGWKRARKKELEANKTKKKPAKKSKIL